MDDPLTSADTNIVFKNGLLVFTGSIMYLPAGQTPRRLHDKGKGGLFVGFMGWGSEFYFGAELGAIRARYAKLARKQSERCLRGLWLVHGSRCGVTPTRRSQCDTYRLRHHGSPPTSRFAA